MKVLISFVSALGRHPAAPGPLQQAHEEVRDVDAPGRQALSRAKPAGPFQFLNDSQPVKFEFGCPEKDRANQRESATPVNAL
jgi:hypothetical protein